jgi:hypothetical protein
VVQNIARALPAESFAALAGSLTLTTVRDRVIEVRGPGGRVMTYEEFFWDDNDPVGDPENPDDVETARWLGITPRAKAP